MSTSTDGQAFFATIESLENKVRCLVFQDFLASFESRLTMTHRFNQVLDPCFVRAAFPVRVRLCNAIATQCAFAFAVFYLFRIRIIRTSVLPLHDSPSSVSIDSRYRKYFTCSTICLPCLTQKSVGVYLWCNVSCM